MSQQRSRREVEEIVLGQLRRRANLGDDRIDTRRSMRELGANSLAITDVVQRSIDTLGLHVARAELEGLRNLDGLIDLLHRKAAEQARPATREPPPPKR